MTDQTQARYVVSERWPHVFDERAGSKDVRFVYDRETEVVAFLQVEGPDGWTDADEIQRDDLTDSLRTANAESLDDVSAWGLTESDDAPDWASSPNEPGPR